MLVHLHLVPLAGFAGLMASAAFEDFRRLVIPNWVTLGLCVLWPLYVGTDPTVTLATGVGAIGCTAAVFFSGALLFSRGLIGGGDVKLLAAATLWAGPMMTPPFLILTALLGGLLTLVLLSPMGTLVAGARTTVFGPAAAAVTRANPVAVPYGIAIAAAAVIVTIPPTFS
jgi:prepilin peptidase CpaA